METCTKLPESYGNKPFARIELERDRTLSARIKAASAALAALLFAAGCLFMPPSALTEMDDVFVYLVALMLGMLSVRIAYELARGFLMRVFSGVKPDIRFTGVYPHVGCEAYFDRPREQAVNLVPPVFLTLLLAIVLFAVQNIPWRWFVWMILIVTVCSCVGDVYAAYRLAKLPEDILVQNVGPTYLVFARSNDMKKQ